MSSRKWLNNMYVFGIKSPFEKSFFKKGIRYGHKQKMLSYTAVITKAITTHTYCTTTSTTTIRIVARSCSKIPSLF